MRKVGTLLLVLVTLVAGAVAVGSSPAAAASGEVLVYTSGCDLMVAGADGSNPRTLVNNPPAGDGGLCSPMASQASISRTGRYVAYTRSTPPPNFSQNVWVYDLSTKTATALTSNGRSSQPDFSPTADVVAYVTHDADLQASNIFSKHVDGTGVHQWTDDHSTGADADYRTNLRPSWDPTGSKIHYVSERDQHLCRRSRYDGAYDDLFFAFQRYVVDTTTGARTRLTDNPLLDHVAVDANRSPIVIVSRPLPSEDEYGYCESEPTTAYRVHEDAALLQAGASPGKPARAADGRVAYQQGVNIVTEPAGGGTVTTLVQGSHPDFGPAYSSGIPTTTTLGYTHSGVCGLDGCQMTKIQVRGGVSPARPGKSVTVRLDVQRSGDWKTASSKVLTLSSSSTYKTTFGRPNGRTCRLVAIYPGDATHLRSTAVKEFSC